MWQIACTTLVALALGADARAASDDLAALVVRGHVADADGPLAGADVWLVPSNDVLRDLGHAEGTASRVWMARLPHTLSEPDGSFTLEVAPALMARGSARNDPCRAWPSVVVQHELAVSGATVVERPVSGAVELEPFVLTSRPGLSGRVLDCAGDPVAGVRAAFERDRARHNNGRLCQLPYEALLAVESDDDGRFVLPVGYPGSRTLSVQGVGVDAYLQDVEPGEADLDVGDVELMCDAHVDVRVLDADGQPMANAWVSLASPRALDAPTADEHERSLLARHRLEPLQEQPSLTDADGRFRFHVSGRFNYSVAILTDGHLGRVLDDVGAGDDLVVELAALDRTEVYVAARASGRVLIDADVTARRLIPPRGKLGLPLQVLPPEGPGRPHVVLGAGHRELLISAEAPGLARGQMEFPPQQAGHAPRVLNLVAPTRLRGLVYDSARAPVVDARVFLAPLDAHGAAGAAAHESATDALGVFAFPDVAAGPWRLELRADGFVTARRDVVVRANGDSRVDQELVREGRLWGLVEGFAALSRSDQRVEVRRSDGTLVRVLATDIQGRFHDDLPPGHYQLLMNDAEPVSVVVPAGESVRADLVGPERTRLAGRVPGLDVPVEGTAFVVEVEPDGHEVLRKVRPFQRGTFEWNVSPGRYVLHAELSTGEHARSQIVQVTDERELDVPLTVQPGTGLSVRVVDAATGAPIPGARIMAVPGLAPGGPTVRTRMGHWPHTDGAGYAQLDGLPAGAYGFACAAPGYEVAPQPVVAVPHADEITVRLVPLGYLSGSVRLSRRDLPAREGTPVVLYDAEGALVRESTLHGGGFTFESLAPGVYRLVVGDDEVSYERRVDLQPGVHETVELLVDL